MKIEVTKCQTCPFMGLNESGGMYYCTAIIHIQNYAGIDHNLMDEDLEGIPDKCPLKNESITVQL